jgi:hypothetical protein
MCHDCQRFFSRLAHLRKRTYVVRDPQCLHVFLPDGSAYKLEAR